MADEISREALLIYLNDVRTMETIIHESENRKEKIAEKENDFAEAYQVLERKSDNLKAEKEKIKSLIERIDASDVKQLVNMLGHQEWVKRGYYGAWRGKIKSYRRWWGSFIIWGIYGLIAGIFMQVMFSSAGIEGSYFPIIFIVIGLFSLMILPFWSKKVRSERATILDDIRDDIKSGLNYEEIVDSYKAAHAKTQNAETELKQFQKEREPIDEKLDLDIRDTKQLLQEAYGLNIIPMQYRTIEGIYYLYDYISTSNYGLTEALLHCSLDSIRKELQEVIRMQGKMLVMQAQANATMIAQNQQILESARATEQNTFVAAKYAQVAATNSALALKLQSKQLGYQMADFWLK